MNSLVQDIRQRVETLKCVGVQTGGILAECADTIENLERELEIRTRQRDWWMQQRNDLRDKLDGMTGWRSELGLRYKSEKQNVANLRAALIAAQEATQDEDGKWVDRNGDYVDALNYAPST